MLLVCGLMIMPACYYLVSLTLRHQAACESGDAGCIADAAFWQGLAIAGFVAGLAIGATGVILDRLGGRK